MNTRQKLYKVVHEGVVALFTEDAHAARVAAKDGQLSSLELFKLWRRIAKGTLTFVPVEVFRACMGRDVYSGDYSTLDIIQRHHDVITLNQRDLPFLVPFAPYGLQMDQYFQDMGYGPHPDKVNELLAASLVVEVVYIEPVYPWVYS